MRLLDEITADIKAAANTSNVEAVLRYVDELGGIAGPEAAAVATRYSGWVSLHRGDYSTALERYLHALGQFQELGDRIGIADVTSSLGNLHLRTSDFPTALEYYQRALALNEEIDNRSAVAAINLGIGLIFWTTGDYPTTLEYYHRALSLHQELGDENNVANATGNIGNVYQGTEDYPAALEHYHRALAIHQKLGDRFGEARVTGSIGSVHGSSGNYAEALDYFQRGLAIHEELGNRSAVALVNGNIISALIMLHRHDEALILLDAQDLQGIVDPRTLVQHIENRALMSEHAGDNETAREHLLHALAIATDAGVRAKASEYHMRLRDLALKQNNLAAYVEHNNEYTRIREEINGKDTATRIAVQAKQREIDAVQREHQKHMAVLHSTLPKHIADRVARGETVNDHFDNAAVLFLDIAGFTTHSSALDASTVVQLLQDMFTTFDSICADHDVMKIKTIGDSYMAVAFGTSNQTANSEQRIANVALAMMSSELAWPHTGERVMFRIGIHSGPVVAGVLGTQRMQYDVWGDTVNVASRMESSSEPGRIQISEALAKALNEELNEAHIVPRGTIEVKGKGLMKTYWLEGA